MQTLHSIDNASNYSELLKNSPRVNFFAIKATIGTDVF